MDFHEPVTLGRSGLRVGRIGIASGYGVPAEAIERAYHECGLNYLYWSSPRRSGMGQAIRNLAPTERKGIVVALQSYDHLGFLMPRFLERGLRAANIDYADVLILGWRPSYPQARVLEAALRLKEQGKVRFLALSSHTRPLLGRIARAARPPIDILMVRYNAGHRGAERDVFPHLPSKNRPGVTTYTATRWRSLLKARRMPPGELPLTASDCYRFALTNPHVDLCMTGPRNVREMDEALSALDGGPLSEEEMAHVKRIGDYVCGRGIWTGCLEKGE